MPLQKNTVRRHLVIEPKLGGPIAGMWLYQDDVVEVIRGLGAQYNHPLSFPSPEGALTKLAEYFEGLE